MRLHLGLAYLALGDRGRASRILDALAVRLKSVFEQPLLARLPNAKAHA